MLTLRQKLVLSFAILILLTFIVSAVSIYHFVRLGHVVEMVLANNYSSIVAAESMKESLERQDSDADFYIMGEVRRARDEFRTNADRFQQQLEIAARNITEPGERAALDDIRTWYSQYRHDLDDFLKTRETVPTLSRIYFSHLEPQFLKLKNRLDDLLTINQRAIKTAGERATNQARRARRYSLLAAAIALLLALLFSWQFTRLVVAPIRLLATSAQKIAEGELDQRIQYRSHDEIGLLAAEFNRMSVRLRELRKSDIGQILIERRKSEAVLDCLYEPVIVTDSQGNVVRLNRAAQLVFGREEGKRLDETVLGDRLLRAVKQAVEMQRPIAEERGSAILPMRVGDAEVSYRLRIASLRDEEGRLSGTVTVLEDVTDLQEVDRFKSNFIQIVSRKLQEPLQSLRLALYSLIRGYAEPLKPQQEQIVSEAEETADQLDGLITDLLELSDVDTGARKLNPERLRPVTLTRDAINRHTAEAASKRITLEHKTYPDLSSVVADRRAMRSILDNLIINAIHFTDRGGHIIVGAHEKEDFVVFYVKDTGRGIAVERLAGIFSRFSAQESDGKGTGLGLALVRRLMEAQGGQVSVESKPGTGSTFSFTLPVAVTMPPRHSVEEG